MRIKTAMLIATCSIFGMAGLAAAGPTAKLAQNIYPRQAYAMMQKDPGITVIDVRTPWEFQFVGHIKGAYNIPSNFVSTHFTVKGQTYLYNGRPVTARKSRYQWVKNPDFLYYVGKLVKNNLNAKIILYCRSAHRSSRAADVLVKAGFSQVYNMTAGFEGGFGKHPYRRMTDGWQHAGLPYQYIDRVGNLDPKYTYPGPMITR